jgi:hypothetical protein
MPEPTPSGFSVAIVAGKPRLSWTNEDTYDYVKVWRKYPAESTWDAIAPLAYYPDTTWDDPNSHPLNQGIMYYLTAHKVPFLPSDPTSELTITMWGDTISDTATATDSVTGLQTYVDTINDTVGVATLPISLFTWVSTITDTATVTDSFTDAVSIKTTFDYYIGMYDGTVHATRSSYLSDNTASITSIWETVETDLGMPNKFKTVQRTNLKYVDKDANTPVSVSISNDGGQTWTSAYKTVGTGDGRTHSKFFWYTMSGEYFKFKVELASADKDFQIIALDIDFLPCGEVIEV